MAKTGKMYYKEMESTEILSDAFNFEFTFTDHGWVLLTVLDIVYPVGPG